MVKWPEADEQTVNALRKAVMCDRWAIAQEGSGKNHVQTVEEALAARVGRQHAVTTCNGSAAIVIALRALGICQGDKVAVPALTWVACATAVHRVGATPVFVDSLPDSPLMNIDQIPVGVTAVLAVHLYASYLDMEKLRSRLRCPDIAVIEDFSHCFGAPGIGVGGDISICSFQASKVLTCGEGGAAFTDDSMIALNLEALRSDSRISTGSGLVPGLVSGENYAMSDISAALLLDQLERLEDQCRRRAAILRILAASSETRFYLDPIAYQGSFYGVPTECYNSVLTRPIYHPIPHSPLYPYRSDLWQFPNATNWSKKVYIPHENFLSETA